MFMDQQVPCIRKKMISLGSRLIACCKLAPTLARLMWRHNYVIDRNEYLILNCQNLSILGYIHCNFCLNTQINHGDMKENVSGCFFWTQCIYWRPTDQRIGLSSVLRLRQHSVGYMGDGFYRSKDLTNSIIVLKEHITHRQIKQIRRHEHKTQQVP